MAKKKRTKNSSIDEISEISKGFHGRDPIQEFELTEQTIYHKNLAQLGELVELEIESTEKRKDLIVLGFQRGDDPVRLCVSKNRKQLEFLGGDQTVDDDWLESVTDEWDKDKVFLGCCFSISYFADKHHLTGPKQQKYGTEYIHEFGEQGGSMPKVIYDRLNKRFELVGGSYDVRDEGIYN